MVLPRPQLTPHERVLSWAFSDLSSTVVLRQLLTPEEVARCNEAIDAMADHESLVGSESYSGGSPLMRGTNNIFNRLAGPIAALKPGADADAVAGALHGITESGRGVIPVEELHAALERFELDGWKLQPAQIDALMETAVELSREGGFVPVAGRPHQVSAPDDGLLSVGCSNWRIGHPPTRLPTSRGACMFTHSVSHVVVALIP